MVKKLTMVAKETIILTKRSYSLFITTQNPAFMVGLLCCINFYYQSWICVSA